MCSDEETVLFLALGLALKRGDSELQAAALTLLQDHLHRMDEKHQPYFLRSDRRMTAKQLKHCWERRYLLSRVPTRTTKN